MRRARPVPYRHLTGTLWPVNQNLPADWPRLAEAGRSYRPRLQAEATGRLGLELALAGRIKAGQGESAKAGQGDAAGRLLATQLRARRARVAVVAMQVDQAARLR